DNGDKTRVTVAGAAPAQTLGNWNLTVDDWRPGTDGSTNTTRHTLTLTEPKPWSDIPQLQDVSGVGTYTTTVRLGRVDGAYLDLGQVTDTFQVTVNGHVLPAPNQVTRRIDLAGHLKEGTNTIAIRVATPLRNRLRVTEGFPAQASQPRQQYGLIGPVHLTPYRETQLKG
ncbi:MAG TPA: hypothetical protein VHJ17_05870, partial [Thermomonospora sp.]|nr:hypothetical protein [Thermomonospora sp.]